MFRRSLSAALVMGLVCSFVLAGTHQGLITKIDDKEVTIKVRSKEDKKGTEKTFKLSKDAKFMKAGKGKDAEPTAIKADDVKKMIEKGIKTKGSDEPIKGVFGKIETEGEGDKETVTTITVGGRGRGGKGGKTDK